MITNVIYDYLDNELISIKNKIELIKNSNLSYSDIFELMDRYSSTELYPALHGLIYFKDSKLESQIKRERKIKKQNVKSKRLKYIMKRGL